MLSLWLCTQGSTRRVMRVTVTFRASRAVQAHKRHPLDYQKAAECTVINGARFLCMVRREVICGDYAVRGHETFYRHDVGLWEQT